MCKIHRLMAVIIPSRRMREVFVVRQIERCPRCRECENLNDPRISDFLNPGWIRENADLWPGIRSRLLSDETKPRETGHAERHSLSLVRKWGWPIFVTGLAASCVLVLIGLRFFEKTPSPPAVFLMAHPADIEARVQVLDTEFEGKRAKSYIYQTPTASFIWIAPSKKNGG